MKRKLFGVHRRTTLFAATAALILGLVAPAFQAVADPGVLSAVANQAVKIGGTITIQGLHINLDDGDEVSVDIYVPTGNMSFADDTDISYIGGMDTGNHIKATGTVENLNKALASLRYAYVSAGQFTVEVTVSNDGDDILESTGHAYRVVDAGEPINWADARDAAEQLTFKDSNGHTGYGYLATITSQEEQDFITARISEDGWIGATDDPILGAPHVAEEGDWTWVTGPEAGMHFWSGTGETGSPVDDAFHYWDRSKPSKEPNNSGNENCGQIRFTGGADGHWNDLACGDSETPGTVTKYVVEFGDPDRMPGFSTTTFDIYANGNTPGNYGQIPGIEPPVDGNNDGHPDNDGNNTNVATMPNANFDNYTTVEIGGVNNGNDCDITTAQATAVDPDYTDGDRTYGNGLVNFTATCNDSLDEIPVRIFYYGVTSTDSLSVRKYNPNDNTYSGVPGATLAVQTIGGQKVVVASYTIADNGALDLNSNVGEIDDPVGIASSPAGPVINTPNTGLGYSSALSSVALLLTGIIVAIGTALTLKRNK